MFHRYTFRARRAVFFARYETSRSGARTIETHHLLLGLMRSDPKLMVRLVGNEVAIDEIRMGFESLKAADTKVAQSEELPLSRGCKKALGYSEEEADKVHSTAIAVGHLILGLLRVEKETAHDALTQHNVSLDDARDKIAEEAETPGGEAEQLPPNLVR